MTQFINPVPYGNLSYLDDKTAEISSTPRSRVVSPFDGKIKTYDRSRCGGYIKIQHLVNGEIYFSELCGVETIITFSASDVRQGETIGYSGPDKITMKIRDNSNVKQKIKPFFNLVTQTTSPTPTTDDKSKTTTSDDKTKTTTSDNKKSKNLSDLFVGGLLKPFGFLHNVMSQDEKKKKDDEELNEEIQRIKKLL